MKTRDCEERTNRTRKDTRKSRLRQPRRESEESRKTVGIYAMVTITTWGHLTLGKYAGEMTDGNLPLAGARPTTHPVIPEGLSRQNFRSTKTFHKNNHISFQSMLPMRIRVREKLSEKLVRDPLCGTEEQAKTNMGPFVRAIQERYCSLNRTTTPDTQPPQSPYAEV